MSAGVVLAALCGVAVGIAGLRVVRARPGHPVGLLLAAVAALAVVSGALGLADGQVAGAAARACATLAVAVGVPWVLLCYPDGWPAGAVDSAAAAVVTALGAALVVVVLAGSGVLVEAGGWCLVVVLVALLWWRTERSGGDRRRALLWLALGVGGPGLVVGVVGFTEDAGDLPGGVATLVVTTAAAVAAALVALVLGLLTPRVVDVRRLISQSTRYAVSAVLVLAVFVGAPAVVELLRLGPVDRTGTAALVVALAATFHPVSVVVQRTFDELLFGHRADPVAVMASLGVELQSGGAPERWVESLREALGVPRVELWARGSALAAAGGATGAGAVRLPLRVGEDEVGALVVALPDGERGLPAETGVVLQLVAIPLAQALQGVRLAAQLAQQRTAALEALEEERRRLRRDLHDGLGPVLTGIAYSADAARNLVHTDPQQAGELLAALREDTAGAIAEVRRIVHGLRPPALDERGLAGAVLQRVDRLRCADGSPLVTVVVATGPLAGLPAAVEVVAYRVAVEAVTNIARHAGPPAGGPAGTRAACVRIAVDGERLELTVTDTGARSTPWVPGVGLASMRERCEQLHGQLTAGPTPDGGEVRAVLPLR